MDRVSKNRWHIKSAARLPRSRESSCSMLLPFIRLYLAQLARLFLVVLDAAAVVANISSHEHDNVRQNGDNVPTPNTERAALRRPQHWPTERRSRNQVIFIVVRAKCTIFRRSTISGNPPLPDTDSASPPHGTLVLTSMLQHVAW